MTVSQDQCWNQFMPSGLGDDMKNYLQITVLLLSGVFPFVSYALKLSEQPLAITGTVHPNVMFLLDDSGSMDWEIMSGNHWAACDYDPLEYYAQSGSTKGDCNKKITDGRIYIGNASGIDNTMTYLFSNTGNIYGNCSWYWSYGFECSDLETSEWRHKSSDLNFMYYNPDVIYLPWKGKCSGNNSCTNANFSSSRSNPKQGESGYSNTRNLKGQTYHVWFDTAGFTNTRPNITDYSLGANSIVDLWDEHYKIELDEINKAVITGVTYDDPDGNSIGRLAQNLATLTNTSACYNILGSQSLVERIHAGELSVNSADEEGCRTVLQASQNYANWYQYHRKRALSAKATISYLVDGEDGMRFGLTLINNNGSGSNDVFVEVPLGEKDTFNGHNNSLLDALYEFNWEAQGTPLRKGLKKVGEYFDGDLSGKDDPILYSCQQNFTILLTDGQWNGNSPSIGNSDLDAYSNSLADVARFYYQKDLSPKKNNVPMNDFDTQMQQHMVTFMAAFGLENILSDTDDDGWPNPALASSGNWGNPFSDSRKADDMWHAAFNSKGEYMSARSPQVLASNLASAISNIQSRVGSGSSVAGSASILQTSTTIYQSQYNTQGWSGHLKAFSLLDGGIGTLMWDASCYFTDNCNVTPFSGTRLNSHNRVVLTTSMATGKGIPFQWDNLSVAQSTYLLQGNTTGLPAATYGKNLVAFLRGSQAGEIASGGIFRTRASTLGDFVHSAPRYVSNPNRFYPSNLEDVNYATFKLAYVNRKPIIYAGANDGMLHGFDAEDGKEVLGYIPGVKDIYADLPSLSKSSYLHRYFVDAPPAEGDVFYDGQWHSVLAGGLGAGGQGVYLLDITDPATFSEGSASKIALWNFTDVDDADLGYTFGEPTIAKMANGRWAVIFASGYNNTVSDGSVSADGKAYLFIVFVDGGLDGSWQEGVDYIKIPVGSAYATGEPNGLSSLTVLDVDGNNLVDYIYAGDIKGHLWRFDVSDVSTLVWLSKASLVFNAGTTQPITSAPIVAAHPYGVSNGFQIFFGTGKYIEKVDNSGSAQSTQTLYSVWDKKGILNDEFSGTVAKSDLVQQKILSEHAFSTDIKARLTTNNAIDWSTQRGWYMDLIVDGSSDNKGERNVVNPVLRNGRIIFVTMQPTSDNICTGGGGSWVMEVDASSGMRTNRSNFDLNGDNAFNDKDKVEIEEKYVVVSGIQVELGILATPTVITTEKGSFDVKVLSGSNGLDTVKTSIPDASLGRQTWRQIR
jgi:type IV pilus assembly protein PilY1